MGDSVFQYLFKMNKEDKRVLIFFSIISFLIGFYYYFNINLSIDLIILFLAEKIFLGKWLIQGVVPYFNPYIFAGIPFLFDAGMGNLHPFNLFFMLPYPFSLSVWIFTVFLMLLMGLYLFFRQFTKTYIFALLCTFIFFFSGSGYWRINNPTILLVIAHYGLFLYFLKDLIKKPFSLRFILLGILMTLSGHIQFVLYGYILGIITAFFIYKISIKRLFIHFLILGVSVSWYFILTLPIVMNSTRLTSDVDYVSMGKLSKQMIIEFIFPFFFGYLQNGSSWNTGYTFAILVSTLFSIFIVIIVFQNKLKKTWIDVSVMLFFLLCSFGVFNFPFFRSPSQILLLLHIWGLLFIAKNEEVIVRFILMKINPLRIGAWGFILSLLAYLFFSTPLFSRIFIILYTLIKKRPPNLFFDMATIASIGKLIGLNFILYIVLFALLFCLGRLQKKKYVHLFIIVFIVFEGLSVNYFHNYYISQDVITNKFPLPSLRKNDLYRIQTGADVIPYFGFSNYMGNVLFRPPFSKERTIITPLEEKNRQYLRMAMSYYPLTWSMTYGLSSVQGYNTFVTKDIADYFKASSSDYEKEYSYIIKRNNLFGQSEKGLAINGIETSRITLNDPRWEKLGVRYFISDRPLKKYRLIEEKNGRYIYENISTLPIYRITDGKTIKSIPPFHTDPNQWKFTIPADDVGKEFQMVMNPGGFVATLNGKEIDIKKEKFLLRIRLVSAGNLVVSYSPIRHLQETLDRLKTN